jgi:hypothetical protein
MEPLIHLLIPLLFLLALFPKLNKKYTFFLLPLAFLMDFDIFIPNEHRFIFHNILFALAIATLIYTIWDKKAFLVSLYYLTSHLILDSANPGSAIFYPFVDKTIYITAQLLKAETWLPTLQIGIVPRETFWINAAQMEASRWMATQGFLIAILLTVLLIAYIIQRKSN